MLAGCRVLIAEDEPLVALVLALSVEEADGEVIGPVATVAEALALLQAERIEAAILDVRLADRDIAPVAHALLERGSSVVFHSASPVPGEIIERFGAVTICPKPTPAKVVVLRLQRQIDAVRNGPRGAIGDCPPSRRCLCGGADIAAAY